MGSCVSSITKILPAVLISKDVPKVPMKEVKLPPTTGDSKTLASNPMPFLEALLPGIQTLNRHVPQQALYTPFPLM